MTATAYLISVTYAGIANDSISDERREALADNTSSHEYMMRVIGSKLQLVSWIAYAMVLWCLKGSLLYFFLGRLTVRFPRSPLPIPNVLCGRGRTSLAGDMCLGSLPGQLTSIVLDTQVDLHGQTMRILLGAGVIVGAWLVLIIVTFSRSVSYNLGISACAMIP